MKNSILFILISIFFFQACKCLKKAKHTHPAISSIEVIAKKKFADNYKILYNTTGEYALVTKSYKELTQRIPDLMFFIYSVSDSNPIFSDTLIAGDVYWLNVTAIRATEREQKAESRRRMYTYDVKLREYILD